MGGTLKLEDDHIGRRDCRRCGAELRRGRNDAFCEPCARRRGRSYPLLEVEFFMHEPIRRALADYDFGYVFRAVRRALAVTQQELGALLDLEQDRISRIERGERPLRDIAIIARIVTRLGIPPALLGFGSDTTSVEVPGGDTTREVDWVQRRDFSWVVAGIVLGVGLDALDIDRLDALLPTKPAVSTVARIGSSDVAAIEQVTDLFRHSDFSGGGGLCRPAAVAKFRSVLALHRASCTAAVRARLQMATADLGLVAAWTSYDAERNNDARRLWMTALHVAQEADHPRAADLTTNLLLDVAHQALYLRRPREASSLVQLAYGAAAGRPYPVSASTASYLASNQAWCHAAQGDARACDRALGRSVEDFADVDPFTAAPWAAHVNAAEHAAQQGHAHYTLALSTSEEKHAARALPFLHQAVAGLGSAYARSRAVNLPELAGAHALTGDLDTAVQVGHRAVEEITALASPRAYDRLRTLDIVLQPHTTHPTVEDMRSRIEAALAVA